MNMVVMLIFAALSTGQVGTLAVRFDTLATCEGARAEMIQKVKTENVPDGARVVSIAVVCAAAAPLEAL